MDGGWVMAWTADGTRFKYSRRVGSRVVTSYFPGPFGAEVAERIAERRRQREKLKEIALWTWAAHVDDGGDPATFNVEEAIMEIPIG